MIIDDLNTNLDDKKKKRHVENFGFILFYLYSKNFIQFWIEYSIYYNTFFHWTSYWPVELSVFHFVVVCWLYNINIANKAGIIVYESDRFGLNFSTTVVVVIQSTKNINFDVKKKILDHEWMNRGFFCHLFFLVSAVGLWRRRTNKNVECFFFCGELVITT